MLFCFAELISSLPFLCLAQPRRAMPFLCLSSRRFRRARLFFAKPPPFRSVLRQDAASLRFPAQCLAVSVLIGSMPCRLCSGPVYALPFRFYAMPCRFVSLLGHAVLCSRPAPPNMSVLGRRLAHPNRALPLQNQSLLCRAFAHVCCALPLLVYALLRFCRALLIFAPALPSRTLLLLIFAARCSCSASPSRASANHRVSMLCCSSLSLLIASLIIASPFRPFSTRCFACAELFVAMPVLVSAAHCSRPAYPRDAFANHSSSQPCLRVSAPCDAIPLPIKARPCYALAALSHAMLCFRFALAYPCSALPSARPSLLCIAFSLPLYAVPVPICAGLRLFFAWLFTSSAPRSRASHRFAPAA